MKKYICYANIQYEYDPTFVVEANSEKEAEAIAHARLLDHVPSGDNISYEEITHIELREETL